MPFKDTLLYRTLSIPGDEWENSCGYVFALKLPIVIFLMVIGIPLAVLIDFIYAASKVGRTDA